MNLEEALQLLQFDLDNPGSVDIEDLNKAQELGIEALDHIIRQRAANPGVAHTILKGETKV